VIGSTNLFKSNFGDVFQSPFSMDELNMLAGKLYITLPGLEIGRLMREELNPAHNLALYSLETKRLGSIELTEDEAIAYLKGEQFGVVGERGWQMVSYQNHSLGWIKNLGNRFNNYYPKEWRIRMK
jgi:NOL1/NOP2/fmu family ribosome biogenesis protein